jgi:hypothetical protein
VHDPRPDVLDERDLVAALVVADLVHRALGDEDAEAAVADAQLLADAEVGNRVLLAGRVREAARVEAFALVGDDELTCSSVTSYAIVTSRSSRRRLPHSMAFSIISSAT